MGGKNRRFNRRSGFGAQKPDGSSATKPGHIIGYGHADAILLSSPPGNQTVAAVESGIRGMPILEGIA